jgi:hypothetical protein
LCKQADRWEDEQTDKLKFMVLEPRGYNVKFVRKKPTKMPLCIWFMSFIRAKDGDSIFS